MSQPKLLDDLLALPVNERAELAYALMESIGAPGKPMGPEESWDEVWGGEVERRLQQVRDGVVETIDFDEAMDAIEQRLKAK